MSQQDLTLVPVHQLSQLLQSRKLSPVDLMQAVIARAEAVEPKINALTYRHFDEAMDQAKKAEAK